MEGLPEGSGQVRPRQRTAKGEYACAWEGSAVYTPEPVCVAWRVLLGLRPQQATAEASHPTENTRRNRELWTPRKEGPCTQGAPHCSRTVKEKPIQLQRESDPCLEAGLSNIVGFHGKLFIPKSLKAFLMVTSGSCSGWSGGSGVLLSTHGTGPAMGIISSTTHLPG